MRRFVDTNLFIYLITGDPEFYGTSKKVLERIEKGEKTITSTLVIDELCIFLEIHGKVYEIPEVIASIRSYIHMQIVPFSIDEMAKASNFIQKHKVDWHDALIAVIMKKHGITEIYSNDAHFDRIEGIKRFFE